MFVVLVGGGVYLVDEGDDGVYVLVVYQFVDVLDMLFVGDVCFVFWCFEQCFVQWVGEWQVFQ